MKKTIVILHGWGISGDKYTDLQKLLKKDGYTIYAPDMPGFGKEKMVKDVMVVDDYVDFIRTYLKKKKITKPVIIAHSFGGRVAAKLAALYPKEIDKLILTGTPLIKRPLPLKKKIAYGVAIVGKRTLSIFPQQTQDLFRKLLYRSIHEYDYYKAKNLKETFKKVVAEDISPLLPTIRTKALLIWGDNDTFVPLQDGKDIAQRLPNARLVVIPGATHKLPYERVDLFYKEVKKFL